MVHDSIQRYNVGYNGLVIKFENVSKKFPDKAVAVFESFRIRRVYDKERKRWFFSIIDIIAALTDQGDFKRAQSYWTTLKSRLKKEGNESVTKCDKLKMLSSDGKFYETDAGDIEMILRLIQSVPPKKAEPIKLWLAKVGHERIQEMSDPEKALNRSRKYWQKLGRSEKWIQQRMMGQETRSKLTDYWGTHGVTRDQEFAILTNIIHEEWSGLSIQKHKDLKGLQNQNLRDHMSEEEIIFTALAELSTRKLAENDRAFGFVQNKPPAKKGGRIARDARLALEEKIGKSVVTGQNFLPR